MDTTLLALIALGLGLWLWRDSLRAREAAVKVCARACEGEGLQFLDQTVALRRIRPVLGPGRPCLRRVYGFEFSHDGADRDSGSVTMLGAHLESLHLASRQPDPACAMPAAGSAKSIDLHRRG